MSTRCAFAFLAALVVLLEEFAPVGVLLGIRLDRPVPPLVLLLPVRLAVQRMAAVHRLPHTPCTTAPASPASVLDDSCRTDPCPVHDLAHPLPGDPKLSSRPLQVVQLLIPRNHLFGICLSSWYVCIVSSPSTPTLPRTFDTQVLNAKSPNCMPKDVTLSKRFVSIESRSYVL